MSFWPESRHPLRNIIPTDNDYIMNMCVNDFMQKTIRAFSPHGRAGTLSHLIVSAIFATETLWIVEGW